MAELKTKLDELTGADPEQKERLLADLAELLNRCSYHGGGGGGFAFHDPEIAALPERLTSAQARVIALRAGAILRDTREPEQVRGAAAFVLGKAHVLEALEAVCRAIADDGKLAAEVARQCAFAYDVLSKSCGPAGTWAAPETLARHFRRQGIPWDDDARRVMIERL
ncbi:MAG: hypothetical protein U0790_11365 [Isosphaeraceae bacterium]